jgi:S-adenosylmethionine:tRNA ribosyltransferase-isomerase
MHRLVAVIAWQAVRIEDFDYQLPAARIAQTPLAVRDRSRLLIDRGPGHAPVDGHVTDLLNELGDGDVVVVNDSKVIPARLALRRGSGGTAEVLLLEPVDADHRVWEALVRPARKLRNGEALFAEDGSPLVVVGARTAAGDTFHVTIVGAGDPFALLQRYGSMPLPPYITAPLADADRYQTVYANAPGSAAAPTAGLHLTPELIASLTGRGVVFASIELVVGLDTFKPVDENDPTTHVIHSERYRVPKTTMEQCSQAKRVVAVGTTASRALETACATGVLEGRSQLFIYRPYQWAMVDLMLTNFHMPRTTLLMMIDAFIGSRWRDLYQQALDRGYRFLSFGDAMLLSRSAPQ